VVREADRSGGRSKSRVVLNRLAEAPERVQSFDSRGSTRARPSPTPSPLRGATSPPSGGRGRAPRSAASHLASPRRGECGRAKRRPGEGATTIFLPAIMREPFPAEPPYSSVQTR
jgi:hypothetical protein